MSELPIAVSRASRAPASDPTAFLAKVKLFSVAGTIAAFGVVWGFVASNAVGVTNRQTAVGPTGTDGDATQPGGATRPGGGDFFAGGAGEPPALGDANRLPTVNGWGSLGDGGAGGVGGGFGGPVMRGGTS